MTHTTESARVTALATNLDRAVAEELALSLGGTGILSHRVRTALLCLGAYWVVPLSRKPHDRRKLACAILTELDRCE